jgi:hypothetical protein
MIYMKKDMKGRKSWFEAGVNSTGKGLIVALLVCTVAGVVLLATVDIPVDDIQDVIDIVPEPTIREETWKPVYIWTPLGAEGDPGAGASGFLEIFYMNISSQTGTGYGLNTSSTHETWCDANMPSASPNAWANADNYEISSFESEKTFIIMVRVRYNKTHAWETDHFNGADCDTQITVTCDDWAVGSNINNVSGTAYETRNNTGEDYIWINFVWDNSGTGYQIADDATLTNSEIYIEAKF